MTAPFKLPLSVDVLSRRPDGGPDPYGECGIRDAAGRLLVRSCVKADLDAIVRAVNAQDGLYAHLRVAREYVAHEAAKYEAPSIAGEDLADIDKALAAAVAEAERGGTEG